MARKIAKKRNQPAGEELSEDQLEAVAGGVSLGDTTVVAPEVEGEEKKKAGGSVLMQACATGQHIKMAVLTVRT